MWIVRKLKLIVPIILTSLLTSFFLLVQICLLESNCHDGLAQVVSTHGQVVTSNAGRTYLQSSTTPLGTIHAYDVKGNGIMGPEVTSKAVNDNNEHAFDKGSNDSSITELLTVNRNVTTASSSLTSTQTHVTPAQSVTEHSSTTKVMFRQIPKSAVHMLQYFQSHRHCRLPHCMDYFSTLDKACLDYCVKKQQKNKGKGKKPTAQDFGMHGECQFMQGEARAAVALASLPGSGNTWIRGLLEKATGICTGEQFWQNYLIKCSIN